MASIQQKHFYSSIQVLRGIAALAVVLLHISEMLLRYTDGRGMFCGSASFWQTGAAGVDLFFVISGFVMVESTRNMGRKQGVAQRFMLRRLIRIVPLYWLYTTLMLVLVLLPFTLKNEVFSLPYTLKSYLFIPALNPVTGLDLPLVPQGWTLSYEMYFYLLFAVLLRLDRRWLIPAVTLFFGLSVITGYLWDVHHPVAKALTSQLLLEFALGCYLARLVHTIQIPPRTCYLCLAGGSALLFLSQYIPAASEYRLFLWGMPVFLLALGFVFLEKERGFDFPGPPIHLGNSSYSLYLSHVFVLLAVGTLLKKKMIPPFFNNDVIALLSTAACIAVGWLSYVFLEKRSIGYLRCKLLSAD